MLNKKYCNRRQPDLELSNAKVNVLYQKGKIYLVEFEDGHMYVGSLEDRI